MSSQPSTHLATRFASLPTATQAEATRAWLSAPFQTLILSILARLFGRLEQLLQLWQSGQFPLPQPSNPHPAGAPRPAVASTPHHVTRPRARRANSGAANPNRVAIPRALISAPHSAPHSAPDSATGRAPSRIITPAARPRPARDPPPSHHPIRRETPRAGVA